MTNNSKPQAANLPALSAIPVPVEYSQQTGLALMLADLAVSSRKVVSYLRQISAADFVSGNYSFPTPSDYVPAPYQLPMLEPTSWNVVADIITAYQPVEVYQIGSTTDLMQSTFPIIINPTDYVSDTETIKPIDIGQSVVIRVYKVASAGINWEGSNIVNNGLTDEAIKSLTQLTMVVTNVAGVYTVTDWLGVNFLTNGMNNLKTSAKGNFSAVINELFDAIAAKTATGDAGGDLTGTYPNPTIGNEKITAAKISKSVRIANPKGLTFTGGRTGTYDGSADNSIPLPYEWAQAESKPNYTAEEVGAVAIRNNGGIILNVNKIGNFNEGVRINTTATGWGGIYIGGNIGSDGGTVEWAVAKNDAGQFLIERGSSGIGGLTLNHGGDAKWRNNVIWHAGNSNRADVAWYASGFFQTSDARMKDVGKPLDCSLEDIIKLLPVYYRWKDTEKMGDAWHIGLIAQEVRAIFPELVSEDEDGNLSLNYAELSAVAIRGIKLLKDKTDDLEDRIARIEDKFSK